HRRRPAPGRPVHRALGEVGREPCPGGAPSGGDQAGVRGSRGAPDPGGARSAARDATRAAAPRGAPCSGARRARPAEESSRASVALLLPWVVSARRRIATLGLLLAGLVPGGKEPVVLGGGADGD